MLPGRPGGGPGGGPGGSPGGAPMGGMTKPVGSKEFEPCELGLELPRLLTPVLVLPLLESLLKLPLL